MSTEFNRCSPYFLYFFHDFSHVFLGNSIPSQDAHAIPGLAPAGLPAPRAHGRGLAAPWRGQVAEAPGACEVAKGAGISRGVHVTTCYNYKAWNMNCIVPYIGNNHPK
jgi:hypothetical protein